MPDHPQDQSREQDQEEVVAALRHAGPDVASRHKVGDQKEHGEEALSRPRTNQKDVKEARQYGEGSVAVIDEIVVLYACKE